MLNDIDFDYPSLDLPNIKWAKKKDKTYAYPPHLCPKVKPLALLAAKKFPRWTFVGYPSTDTIIKLNIYEGREKVGTISYTHARDGFKYVISSARIEKARVRGNGAETKDVKKALKLMASSFGAKTNSEKLTEAGARLGASAYAGNSAAYSRHHSTVQTLYRYLTTYIFDNLEKVKAAAIAEGMGPELLDKLPDSKEDADTTKEITQGIQDNKGWLVVLDGSSYLVKDGEDILVLSSDQLPSDLKGKLGMLKLLEDNHFMRGTGYRLDASTFFVMRGEP